MANDATTVSGELPHSERERLRAIRLTAVASLIGTTIEWYDFILYTSLSGLIFNKLFFPASDPLVSLLLAYATFAEPCSANCSTPAFATPACRWFTRSVPLSSSHRSRSSPLCWWRPMGTSRGGWQAMSFWAAVSVRLPPR